MTKNLHELKADLLISTRKLEDALRSTISSHLASVLGYIDEALKTDPGEPDEPGVVNPPPPPPVTSPVVTQPPEPVPPPVVVPPPSVGSDPLGNAINYLASIGVITGFKNYWDVQKNGVDLHGLNGCVVWVPEGFKGDVSIRDCLDLIVCGPGFLQTTRMQNNQRVIFQQTNTEAFFWDGDPRSDTGYGFKIHNCQGVYFNLCHVQALQYCIWCEDSSAIVCDKSSFRSGQLVPGLLSPEQSTIRLVSCRDTGLFGCSVRNDIRFPGRHSYRVHGASSQNVVKECKFTGGGIMVGTTEGDVITDQIFTDSLIYAVNQEGDVDFNRQRVTNLQLFDNVTHRKPNQWSGLIELQRTPAGTWAALRNTIIYDVPA